VHCFFSEYFNFSFFFYYDVCENILNNSQIKISSTFEITKFGVYFETYQIFKIYIICKHCPSTVLYHITIYMHISIISQNHIMWIFGFSHFAWKTLIASEKVIVVKYRRYWTLVGLTSKFQNRAIYNLNWTISLFIQPLLLKILEVKINKVHQNGHLCKHNKLYFLYYLPFWKKKYSISLWKVFMSILERFG
jgi:hypothetical protein